MQQRGAERGCSSLDGTSRALVRLTGTLTSIDRLRDVARPERDVGERLEVLWPTTRPTAVDGAEALECIFPGVVGCRLVSGPQDNV